MKKVRYLVEGDQCQLARSAFLSNQNVAKAAKLWFQHHVELVSIYPLGVSRLELNKLSGSVARRPRPLKIKSAQVAANVEHFANEK